MTKSIGAVVTKIALCVADRITLTSMKFIFCKVFLTHIISDLHLCVNVKTMEARVKAKNSAVDPETLSFSYGYLKIQDQKMHQKVINIK